MLPLLSAFQLAVVVVAAVSLRLLAMRWGAVRAVLAELAAHNVDKSTTWQSPAAMLQVCCSASCTTQWYMNLNCMCLPPLHLAVRPVGWCFCGPPSPPPQNRPAVLRETFSFLQIVVPSQCR